MSGAGCMPVMQASIYIGIINANPGFVESCNTLSTHEAAPLRPLLCDLPHSNSADTQADELSTIAWWRGGLSEALVLKAAVATLLHHSADQSLCAKLAGPRSQALPETKSSVLCACRLVNIHIINTAGVASYNMAPCIECWCRNPADQARDFYGGLLTVIPSI